MERLPANSNISKRIEAFGLVSQIYKADRNKGYFAGIKLFEHVGATPEEADQMMDDLSVILDNEEPTDELETTAPLSREDVTISLPIFEIDTASAEGRATIELISNLAWFIIGYMNNENIDIHQQGQDMLGSTPEEAELLIEAVKADPQSAVRFIRRAFEGKTNFDDILSAFLDRNQ